MASNGSVVELRAGRLVGVRKEGVSVFWGVPYAQPPVGPLRFRPPVEGTPWEGVRQARSFGSIAHQFPTDLEQMQGRLDLPQSEDCLTLNIWTPQPDTARRPVMVWIHGGAYLNGTGAAEWFDGTSFATRHDVVLVTINYRLAVFGYLHLAGLSPEEVGSGNCGLLDQIAALQWVADNIASFGGDPDNVTVFGESAGAMSVGVLLGTPGAAGLFHRAILQSGAASNVTTAEDATAVAVAVLAALGLSPDGEGVTRLRELPASEIMAAYGAVAVSHAPDMAAARIVPTFAPVVDGAVLPQEPLRAIREGASSSVPVMIGTNRDEMEVMRLLDKSIYDFGDDEIDAACRQPVRRPLGPGPGPLPGTRTRDDGERVDRSRHRSHVPDAGRWAGRRAPGGGRGHVDVPVHLADHRVRGADGSGAHPRDPLRLQQLPPRGIARAHRWSTGTRAGPGGTDAPDLGPLRPPG